MPGVARIGDAISHGGQITSASADITSDGLGVARIGDTAQCDEHGTVTIVGGSSTVKGDNIGIARIGDQCSCGAIITGSSSTSVSG
jgi:uncharacterized Zn-binding protein involved in type VI secretion